MPDGECGSFLFLRGSVFVFRRAGILTSRLRVPFAFNCRTISTRGTLAAPAFLVCPLGLCGFSAIAAAASASFVIAALLSAVRVRIAACAAGTLAFFLGRNEAVAAVSDEIISAAAAKRLAHHRPVFAAPPLQQCTLKLLFVVVGRGVDLLHRERIKPGVVHHR